MKNNILILKDYLGTSTRSSRDECGDLCILGTKGKIYMDDNHWYLYVFKGRWSLIKEKLSFMEVCQDGDTEGILKLNHYPTKEEAKTIRKVAGFRKFKEISESQRETLKKHGFQPAIERIN